MKPIASRRPLKPQHEIIAAIFDAAQHDLDKLRRGFADMVEQADTKTPSNQPALHLYDDDPRPHPDLIRAPGGHSDPTGETALKTNAARTWLKAIRHDLLRLQTRVVQMEQEIGYDVCPKCREDIKPGQRTRTIKNELRHAECAGRFHIPDMNKAA